ncbi:MAG: Maf-like protein [Halieaceae bacterium]|nr:MAG: Maf-like protein [Halieaceae bacterium]
MFNDVLDTSEGNSSPVSALLRGVLMTLVLASSSPRRRELLSTLVAQFDIRSPEIDEIPHQGSHRSIMSTDRDAESVKALSSEQINLGADTTVVLEGQIIGKPSDVDEARWILGRLSGKTHTVYTAVALAQSAGVDTLLSATKVTLTQLSQSAIDAYLLSDEPWDKAGAYGIQGYAGAFVERIEGVTRGGGSATV